LADVIVSVVGCGYLGAVHAAAMASLGHTVVGVDVDEAKVAALASGRAPFFEPGLEDLLAQVCGQGALRFTTDLRDAAGAAVHFVCVGTPQAKDSRQADLTHVDAAMASLLELARATGAATTVVGKSTVPVGTAARWAEAFDRAGAGVTLVWNPEFLREGFAVKDTLHPDRIVYGLPPGERGRRAAATLDDVYGELLRQGVPKIETDYATAELVKVAANSFLATKISFINAMAEVADAAGADVLDLALAIGLDPRIGSRFLRPGIGFGGGCLPKDIRAFLARAEELGAADALRFLAEVDEVNLRARRRLVDLVARCVTDDPAGDLPGARVAVLGAAFKPDSDDIRDSPALDIAAALAGRGATVLVYDPAAGEKAKGTPGVAVVASTEAAVTGADVVVVATEWQEFRDLDPAAIRPLVRRAVVADGRLCLDATAWRAAGWTYVAPGRPGL
jgi:UDPglucose 6-dehydrogenase